MIPRRRQASGSVFCGSWRRTASRWWPLTCRSRPSAMWRSTATSFVGYRAPGSTDRLLGEVRTGDRMRLNDPVDRSRTTAPVSSPLAREFAWIELGSYHMKIVVIGGTGRIGSKVVGLLRQRGQEVLAASPDSGVNALTGEGLAGALAGAQVVVDAMWRSQRRKTASSRLPVRTERRSTKSSPA